MKKRLVLGLISCVPLFGLSQQFTGFTYDNYSGVHGMLQNPASVAGSKYKVNINFFSMSALAGNNAYELKNSNFKSFDFSDLEENRDYFKSGNTDKKNLWMNTDIMGPSFMFTSGKKSGIGLYTRARTIVNQFNLSDRTFRFFGADDALYNTDIQEENLQLKAHAFAEAGLTYGRIIYNAPNHLVKMGITGKYVIGMAAASVYSKKLAVNIDKNDFINKLEGDLNVRYSGNLDAVDDDFSDILDKSSGNHGLGFDLGFVYEWRPESSRWLTTDQTPYKLRVSTSLNDLGSVKYNNSEHGDSYSVNASARTTDDLDKQDGETFDEYFTRLENQGIITSQTHADKLKVKLPATFRIDADYHIYKRLFINAGAIVNLINKDKNELTAHYATSYTITPRLEKKWFSIYSPLYYNTLNKKMAWGAGLRAGFLFLGSGSVLSNMLSNKNVTQADFHIGFTLPIYQRVKTKRYKGKKTPVEKTEKEQPAEAPKPQPVEVAPQTVVETKVDTVVKNVEVIKEVNVTRDKDNDGIVDEKDECPDVAGEVALAGCPDKDKDGIADKNDKCVEVPGIAKYNGCPIPDTDGDGINDEEDKCPQVAGIAKYNGCPIPDTDGDGLNDEEDKCPSTPGKPANNGCPEIKQEVVKKIAIAAKSIYYMSGKDVIQKVSYPKLDVVVKVLKADTALQISIEGHTDNTGNAVSNLKLSAKRAQAVKNYLIKKGISASRISAQGFGDAKPVAPNTTPAGRTKNRRVELHLNYQ
jgi:outer membrane protein OmpA-like peptidoglycan-associated protein